MDIQKNGTLIQPTCSIIQSYSLAQLAAVGSSVVGHISLVSFGTHLLELILLQLIVVKERSDQRANRRTGRGSGDRRMSTFGQGGTSIEGPRKVTMMPVFTLLMYAILAVSTIHMVVTTLVNQQEIWVIAQQSFVPAIFVASSWGVYHAVLEFAALMLMQPGTCVGHEVGAGAGGGVGGQRGIV
jgi:hypothetical protein